MDYLSQIVDIYNGIYERVVGSGSYAVLWCLAILYLYMRHKKTRNHMLLPFAIMFVVALNPLTIFIMARIVSAGEASRLLWTMMGVFVIAFVATDYIFSLKGGAQKLASIILVIVLMLSGSFIFRFNNFSKANNLYNLDDSVIQMADYLESNYQGQQIICSKDLLCELHQYDATIPMYYGRWDAELYIENVFYYSSSEEAKQYMVDARAAGVSLIVLEKSDFYKYRLNACGWYVCDEYAGYDIYCPADDGWIIANYVDESGNQGMFYTIYQPSSQSLIVVDSGWKENADQVKRIIKEYGGHVNAWFLTHYDNDHVDAFNSVFDGRTDITVDNVYVTPLDGEVYMSTLRDWDTPESYKKFMEVSKNMPVTQLHRGDALDVCGLKLDVFNAYDDIVLEKGASDLPNDASLVFKLSANDKSILFCGDCHDLGNELVSMYGDKLQSTYVQVGHHGHNSFPIEFYEVVKPEVAIFDAPAWEMEGKNYNAAALAEALIERGVMPCDYRSGIHNFILR